MISSQRIIALRGNKIANLLIKKIDFIYIIIRKIKLLFQNFIYYMIVKVNCWIIYEMYSILFLLEKRGSVYIKNAQMIKYTKNIVFESWENILVLT